MSTNLPFPLADFYDALVAKNVKQKLDPFIAQFRKKNIYIIYQCVNRLIQIITNKSQLPIMKFNSLMAIRYFFDTCQYAAITFIEIYMLPVIYQIAVEKYLKRSQQGIQLYFVDRGAQNTKQIRRLGLNYVQLAAQLIFNCAKVKPYRLIQNKQLKQESNFARTVKVLNNKGIQEAQKCIYYIPSYPIQTRKKFLKKLKHLSPQPYISFVISQYLEEINLNKKCDLDIKKLLLFGDSFLTSTIVQIIEQELSKMSQNFINKKKYLNLLNDLIRSGQIQSIYLVNTSDFINQIAEQIGKVKGNVGADQGQYIYPKIQASKQQKKQFYIEFLRVIQIWAYCMPVTDEGQQSDVLKIYEDLKKRNFIFPKNVILKKIKTEMQENLLMNQQRNQTLIKIIDEDDRTSSRNVGSYVSSKGEFKFHFPEYKEKASYLQIDQLQYKVFETKKKIARLSIKKQQLQQNMQWIQNFNQNWQQDLQKLDIQDEDPHELQILVDQGDLCCEQFEKVLPIYELYTKDKMTFDQFAKKIQFLQNSDQNQSKYQQSQNNSQVSQDRKTLLQSHHKPSTLSQSVRKHIHDQYYTQYGHHYQRQQKSISIKNKNQNDDKQISVKNKSLKQSMKCTKPDFIKNDLDDDIESKIQSKKNFKQPPIKTQNSFVKQESRMSQSRKVIQKQKQISKYENAKSPQKIKNYIMQNINSNKQNLYANPLKQTAQKFDRDVSQISSSEQSNQLSEKQQPQIKTQTPQKKIQFRTEKQKQKTPPINFQSSESDFKIQSNEKKNVKHISLQYDEYTPNKKSVIKHSVISKSSYHSQPTQPKNNQSGFNEGNSMMNDYEIQNIPIVNNAGITVKKSSIKRTQNSGMKASSHKRIQQSPSNNKSPSCVVDAVSPFKKKKSSLSKEAKIKQSYLKEFEFIRTNKKPQTRQINDEITYDDVFRRRDEFDASKNYSQISSQSESVIQKRNKKLLKKSTKHQTARINLNDESQYYVENNQSVLKKSKDRTQLKSGPRTPSKNIILFDSKHQSPKKQSVQIQKVHQEYDIRYQDGKIKNLTDKISQFSKNASRFGSSKVKSGIKLISKNDHKSFDSLYKNQYNPYGESGVNKRYQQVTSEYNQGFSRTRSPNYLNTNGFSPPQKSSVIQNPDYSPVSLQEINKQIQRFKNKPKLHRDHPDISQIHQPQNMPMLYSYCSDKSIHSKMTDSHTRKGNSSNYNDFRACFLSMDREVLPLNLTKSKAVSTSFSLDKAKNFIDFRGSNAKSSSKVNTVVDAISQKNAKNSILLYKLERQKTRLVQNLQNKIKQLQVNGKMMKTKFAMKDQSIRQNKQSRQYSQRQLKLNYPQTKTSRQSSNQNNSLSNYDLLKKSKKPNDSPTNKQQHQGLTNLMKNKSVINTKIYEQFFNNFQINKKALYKKKGLLTKNDQIQIGYMISKKQKHVIVNVFITPNITSIKNVLLEVDCDHNLAVKIKPGRLDLIEAKKQQIIICSFTVQNVPFKLPSIKISFDSSRNYKKNNYFLGLPCTILSFSEMNQKNQSNDEKMSDKQIVCTQIFKISKKINKAQKLKQTLPSFKQVKCDKKMNRFEGQVKYQNHEMNISIWMNEYGNVLIQGYSRNRQVGVYKYLQYLMSSMRFMLQEQINNE